MELMEKITKTLTVFKEKHFILAFFFKKQINELNKKIIEATMLDPIKKCKDCQVLENKLSVLQKELVAAKKKGRGY